MTQPENTPAETKLLGMSSHEREKSREAFKNLGAVKQKCSLGSVAGMAAIAPNHS